MRKSTNIPYVKRFDENGVLLNPIRGIYQSLDTNREQRRSELQKTKPKKKNYYMVGGCQGSNPQAIFYPRKKRAKDFIIQNN